MGLAWIGHSAAAATQSRHTKSLTRLHRARRGRVAADEIGDVETGDRAVDDGPSAADHHAVGAVRAAEHQRGERVAVAGEAQLVELEQREVGDLADRDLAELGAAYAGRRATGGPAQRVLVADLADAKTRPLQQKSRPHLLHQIGRVIRSGAIDAEANA